MEREESLFGALGVGMLGHGFIGRAHSIALRKLEWASPAPSLLPRLVGYAMHALPADSDVPWHRVVNAAGKISIRGDGLGHDELQVQLLEREGVRFVGGAIPLARYRWSPRR